MTCCNFKELGKAQWLVRSQAGAWEPAKQQYILIKKRHSIKIMNNQDSCETLFHEELPEKHEDPFIGFLHRIIRIAIKVLALLMVFVIIWGIGDVIYVLYLRLNTSPLFLLNINDIFQTFSAFMAVLIAIEIFINIRLYLGTSVLPVQLVVATALMAIARKVIVLDLDKITSDYLLGIAAIALALGITYWLISQKIYHEKTQGDENGHNKV